MYIVFGNRVADSNEFKKLIEENSEFKVLKDMSKGSKREDIAAYNLSISINVLSEILKDDMDISEISEEDLFDEYLTLAEELGTDLEEFMPDDSLFDIKSYKWDMSDNNIKLVIAIAHEELGEGKLKDIMKRLLTQVE